ncbi:MAG: SRPBCC family protein [Planctomycetaceae bacterium]
MQIDNAFTVHAPIGDVWTYLLDVEKVAPCMPGAELTETIHERAWKGKVNVAFGPVKLAFVGTVEMQERDDATHRVSLHAKGTEQKGKGAANATVTSWLEPGDEGTLVQMQADITLTGAAAQLSRGLLPEISKKLTQQFADCLEAAMNAEAAAGAAAVTATGAAPPVTAPAPGAVAAKPVGGIGLGIAAVWATIVNFFKRLFGRGKARS